MSCSRRKEIEALVSGRLQGADAEGLLDHMQSCETCLEEADRLWASSPALSLAMPEPQPEELARGEQRMMARLSRSDLSGESLLLATLGVFLVFLSLLEPLIALFDKPNPEPRRRSP